jgi:ERCC4-type nuclease
VIQVDTREPKTLRNLFRKEAEVKQLAYGDFAFSGNDEDGPVFVGIERKTWTDLVTSLTSGRLISHQIPGLCNTYNHRYLLIEGMWKNERKTGLLMVKNGRGYRYVGMDRYWMSKDVFGWINTLCIKGGLNLVMSNNIYATAAIVTALHTWWAKPYSSHKGLDGFKRMEGTGMVKPTLFRRVAAELPGVGWDRSQKAVRHFGSVLEMMQATEDDWASIEGIGPKTAAKVVAAIRRQK